MLKRKWLCMTLLLLSNLSVFSQSVTEPEVRIKRSQAIATVKDLTRYDSLKVRYQLLEENIENLKRISHQKDLKLQEYKESEDRYKVVVGNYSAMQQADKKRYSDLEKKFKKEVRAGRFKVVLLGGALAFGIYKTLK